jgi:hypothetical protein
MQNRRHKAHGDVYHAGQRPLANLAPQLPPAADAKTPSGPG